MKIAKRIATGECSLQEIVTHSHQSNQSFFTVLQIVVFLVCSDHDMGLIDGLKKAVAIAGAQITSSSPNPQGIYFTANFQQKAKAWGVSEKDALDVFYHGQESKPGMKTRKYNGYELSIYYGQSKTTGQPYISTIW